LRWFSKAETTKIAGSFGKLPKIFRQIVSECPRNFPGELQSPMGSTDSFAIGVPKMGSTDSFAIGVPKAQEVF
jgi:hypothetical protein